MTNSGVEVDAPDSYVTRWLSTRPCGVVLSSFGTFRRGFERTPFLDAVAAVSYGQLYRSVARRSAIDPGVAYDSPYDTFPHARKTVGDVRRGTSP